MSPGNEEKWSGVMPQEAKQLLLEKSEISLWLDCYDDIFSDFDSRPFTQRSLSQDFLGEAKRASRDKELGKIELALLIPHNLRNQSHESLIRKRLLNHFKKHKESVHSEKMKMVKEGMLFVAIGIAVMFSAVLLVYNNQENLFSKSMLIILEPAGWFFFWEGLRQVLIESRTKNADIDFYDKMSRCDIRFLSY